MRKDRLTANGEILIQEQMISVVASEDKFATLDQMGEEFWPMFPEGCLEQVVGKLIDMGVAFYNCEKGSLERDFLYLYMTGLSEEPLDDESSIKRQLSEKLRTQIREDRIKREKKEGDK